ncbi:MAG: hypothetical protein KGZ69_03350 [Methylomonas sp.]|nr:hypothetical protein [Methylomonas sp.]
MSTGGGIGAFMEGAFGGYSAARQIDRQAEIDKLLSGRSISNPATTPVATPGPTTPAAIPSATTQASATPMTPRGVIAPTTPGPAITSRAVSNPNAAKEMYDYIVSRGVSHEHALGMITNMQGESGFNPAAYNPNDLGAPSGGLFQHHKGRLSAMEKAVPDWKTNWKGQIDYALGERETQKYLGTKYKDGSEATAGFVEQFEKPKDARQAIAKRTGFLPSIERVVTRPQNGMRSDGIMDFMSSRFPIPRGL